MTECYQRKESILPQQALALANSELTLRQRAGCSARSDRRPAPTRRASSRPRSSACCRARRPPRSWRSARRSCTSSRVDGRRRIADAGHRPRARENLVHVLLNHHDFVTMR